MKDKNIESIQKAWTDGYDAGMASAREQSRSTALLAVFKYHEGKAEVAEVYGRLHQEADCRLEWQKTRNRHLAMADAIRALLKKQQSDSTPNREEKDNDRQ